MYEMIPAEIGTSENGFIQVLNEDKFKGKELVIKGAYTLLMALKNKSEE
jgi:cobalt-zinc-cadmium efflux system membrane fusion protein